MFIGPILSVPIGFFVFTIVCVILLMILSEVSWKIMEHLPEDEQNWSDGNHFVMEDG